jgi:hypothetical protein
MRRAAHLDEKELAKARSSRSIGRGAHSHVGPWSALFTRSALLQFENRRPMVYAVAFLLQFTAAVVYGQFATGNLLVNPGAETGNLTGWTVGGNSSPFAGGPANSLGDGFATHSGSHYFVGGTGGAYGSLTQTIQPVGIQGITADMLDSGNAFVRFSFWEQGSNQGTPSDNASVTLRFIVTNFSGQPITSQIETPIIDSHAGAWRNYTNACLIPPGTRSLQYTINFYRHSGTDLDAFVDDNYLGVSVAPPPSNDNFASRATVVSPVATIFAANLGATLESGEPSHTPHAGGKLSADKSLWWTWTSPEDGPIILTSFGSSFGVSLEAYTGLSLNSLSEISANAGFDFPSGDGGDYAAPTSLQDNSTRVRFDAAAGQAYQIAVAGGPGDISLNFVTLAIEDIQALERTVQANGKMSFTANLKITNFRPRTTGPLRVRLIQKAVYRVSPDFTGDLAAFNTPDGTLGTVAFPSPGFIADTNPVSMIVTGLCAAATGGSTLKTNWNAVAILEEMAGGIWNFRDARVVAPAYYANLDGLNGGGVVTLSSSSSSSLFPFGNFRILLEPASDLSSNAGWRILQLTDTGYYNDNSAIYGLVAATNYTLSFRPVPGFLTPSNRPLTVTANQTNIVTVIYTNIVPQNVVSGFTNAAFTLAFTAPSGQRYALERSTNFANWTPLLTSTVPAGGTLRFTNSGLNNIPNAYYRARFVP